MGRPRKTEAELLAAVERARERANERYRKRKSAEGKPNRPKGRPVDHVAHEDGH